jgi:hypothetical protein
MRLTQSLRGMRGNLCSSWAVLRVREGPEVAPQSALSDCAMVCIVGYCQYDAL